MPIEGVTDRYITGHYASRNPTWHEEDSAWKAHQVFRILASNSLSPVTVCDWGCGTGGVVEGLTHELPEARVVGYEPSPNARRVIPVRRRGAIITEAPEVGTIFDVVTLLDVLEHVEDCFGLVRRVSRYGRHIVLHIPLELSILSISRPTVLCRSRTDIGHLHFFTAELARELLLDCGLQIVDVTYTKPSLELRRQGNWRYAVARIPRAVIGHFSAAVASRLFGGFSLLVLARRADLPEARGA